MLNDFVVLIVTFSAGGLAGYFYRDHLSKMRHRRALAHRYFG
jgi:hypothetical protein